ncbi:DUF6351 family protein [Amycolatopsis anabasis]|uniref:DUF6351 family protein n=1 Tax=Amycolatopsis anabasis TaxID=1840409 RepID=UPI001C554693|nr:DUF6351 family protein [Amycolatopsis anabasis]
MRRLVTAILAAATALGLAVPAAASAAPAEVRIQVLSNRADLVSGGDALVEVSVSGPERPRIDVDGRDVTGRFAPEPGGRFVGLVDGLKNGANVLSARIPGRGARLTITNHPIGGPVFAGPQVRPWACGTVAAGLGEPVDAQCNAPSVRSYVYRNAVTGTFLPYDPAHPPLPALVAKTTTDQGRTVPYVVRVEKGTMDRGIYQLAVLDEPGGEDLPPAWNHKLSVRFEGGAGAHHSQDAPPDVLDHVALSRGFLVATSGLLVHASNENQVVSAEALMMLKERIVERYGRIRYTIGNGCSGGSIQQQLIAGMYPGLLDGIQPTCSYPDLWTTGTEVADCHLLLNYFNHTAPLQWLDPVRRAAVDGHQSVLNCGAWEAAFGGLVDPAAAANCNLPADQVYHPRTNPGGVRCAVQDYQKAVWGPRPQDGFAKRPLDNVGVQYGLNALNRGVITPEQFTDLNARVGGTGIDWNLQPGRIEADPGAAEIAHRTGQITDARQLATVPIIDLRPYIELEIHTSFHSYQMRAKLDRDNGGHANQVIWTFPVTDLALPFPNGVLEKSFVLLDQWLAGIERDSGSAPLAAKVIRNKPGTAVDTCWILGARVTDPARCAAAYPHYGDSRIAAGSPLADDIVKCQLKPLTPTDYRVSFTEQQWARLELAFPGGVCDWTKPGVGQRASTPWTTFANGPGGRPLGPPPVSTPER